MSWIVKCTALKTEKFILIIPFLLFFLIGFLPLPVSAEAGLSEAGRSKFYKINNELGVDVLPASKSSNPKDNISFFKYKRNPEYDNFLGRFCNGKYISDSEYDGVYFAHTDVYIQDNFVWSEDSNDVSSVIDLETGEVWDFEAMERENKGISVESFFKEGKIFLDFSNSELEEETIKEKSKSAEELEEEFFEENGLDIEKAQKYDLEYIEANYGELDMDNLQDLSCFIMGGIIVTIILPILLAILLIISLILFFKRKREQKRVSSVK